MMHNTHAALSGLFGLLFVKMFPFDTLGQATLFLVLVVIFGSVPDLDHENSKISKRYPKISSALRMLFTHRSFSHSIFPVILFFFLFRYLGYPTVALGISFGIITHLIGDAITVEGINLLAPFAHFKIEGFIHSGTFMETIAFFILLIADGFLIYTMIPWF